MSLTRKQKEILDYISDYSSQNGYAPTQKEIKEHFNLKSFGSVQRYIKYLASMQYLEGDWNARRGLKITHKAQHDLMETPQHRHHGVEEIPLLGLVAAGNPIEAIENNEKVSVPPGMLKSAHNHFALTIKGQSMIEDGILDGDVVVCRQANHANQGETIVATIDGNATIKNYYKHAGHIELRPANSSMKPIIVRDGDFCIVGILVGLLRSY